ncbi:MAG: substrate-binding domain-containing protein, partial [Propionicimonas sp.]
HQTAVIAELTQRGVDKFVFAAMATREVEAPALANTQRGVLLNCSDSESEWPVIVPDDRAAAAVAVNHLIAAGHGPRIWLVGEALATGPYAGSVRREGVVQTLSVHGCVLAHHVASHWWPPQTREAFAAELADTDPADWPTAVIAMNDRTAMGVYQAAQAAGLVIPRDLSVISFDNSEVAWWLDPGLTSMELPYQEMGRLAVEEVLREPGTPHVVSVRLRLHERDSIMAPSPPSPAHVVDS